MQNKAFLEKSINWLLNEASMHAAIAFYKELYNTPGCDNAVLAELGRNDRFFLLVHLLKRADMVHPWIYARCREVEKDPDGYIDLWAREHGKSTIITFAGSVQDVLKDPNVTIGIFSHSRPIAKQFLRQIKREFESNEMLLALYHDVLWKNPAKDAPKWSEDEGIIVRRSSNPKESTIEAWGLVDGQPVSKHFSRLVYDDVVVQASVTTPEMIDKTTQSLELSYALGAEGGTRRFIGTRYHFNDSYRTVISRGTCKPRIYPATDDGSVGGKPVLLTAERLAEKRRDMGPYTFSSQLLQNPKADETQGFKREWIRYYKQSDGTGMNKYLLVDAANGKRKSNDYTAAWIIGLAEDGNYYVLDMIRDRLNLTQRAEMVMRLHRKWKPVQVRYEKYGLMADIEHIKAVQEQQNYRFEITEVGGAISKGDRIKRLVPLFEQGKVYMPNCLYYTDYEGSARELVHAFTEEEYMSFPVSVHDDMLDALARIAEPEIPLDWPIVYEEPERYGRYGKKSSKSYMTA